MIAIGNTTMVVTSTSPIIPHTVDSFDPVFIKRCQKLYEHHSATSGTTFHTAILKVFEEVLEIGQAHSEKAILEETCDAIIALTQIICLYKSGHKFNDAMEQTLQKCESRKKEALKSMKKEALKSMKNKQTHTIFDTFGPAPRTSPLCYPGVHPLESYLLSGPNDLDINPIKVADTLGGSNVGGATLSKKLDSLGATPLERRYPIIGYGSNANPAQLQNKFYDKDDDTSTVIPVFKATLEGYDVVYANSFASYGSIPATITASPGTTVSVWITLLDKSQLATMDKTEGRNIRYWMAQLLGEVRFDDYDKLIKAFAYVHAEGVLNLEGAGGPTRLATIPAQHPRFTGLDQYQILQKISRLLNTDMKPEQLVDTFPDTCEYFRKKLKLLSVGMNSIGYNKLSGNDELSKLDFD